jgi:hypothetical protein
MKVKIVFHTIKELRSFSAKPINKLAKKFEKESGVKIELIPFIHKHLDGETLDNFLDECKNAQIIITDYWNHPVDEKDILGIDWDDPFISMANVVKKAKEKNPKAAFFATMKRNEIGSISTLVHTKELAEPIICLFDEKVLKSIKKFKS